MWSLVAAPYDAYPRRTAYLVRLTLIGVLNLWWTLLIGRIVVSTLRTGSASDVREEKTAGRKKHVKDA